MSVYNGESPDYLAQSMESLRAQTKPADEILIVKDGPLRQELETVLNRYSQLLPIVTCALNQNQGLGIALRIGVERCTHELIARMDSDDIAVPTRLEKLASFLDQNPRIDAVGSLTREFHLHPGDGSSIRQVPAEQDAIRAFAKKRNPMNHPSVAFRKSAALAAGNYRSWIGFEDYHLWVRMLLNGSELYNIQEPLLFMRCGNGMQNRRGGWKYARREAALFWDFRRQGFLTTPEAIRNIALRCPSRMLPTTLRAGIYERFLRRKCQSGFSPQERLNDQVASGSAKPSSSL